MENIRKQYKAEKCNICKNRKERIEKDKCNMKVFQIDNYLYCKCENCSLNNKELKRKII